MSGWDLVGEEAEAIYHPGLLPLDWRTRAKALLASDLGRYEALECWQSGTSVVHGVECWAPPGEWYGGGWVDWSGQTGDAPDGWWAVQQDHACDEHGADILCLGLDKWDDDAVRQACADAPPEVHLIAAGDGWPWFSRIIGPCTVVVLR